MDLTLNREQEALRKATRGFLSRRAPAATLAETLDVAPHWEPKLWPEVAAMGWLGVSAPVERGGVGLGLLEETIVLEEVGAALLPAPVHSVVGLALPLLLRASDCDDLLMDLIQGDSVVTLAWPDGRGHTTLDGCGDASNVQAQRVDGQWRLDGNKRWVPDAERADWLLVPAEMEGGVGLFAADQSASGLEIRPLETIDPVRPLADVTLVATPARLILSPQDTTASFSAVRDRALTLAAAEAIGITRRMLELAADHASNREQFGRLIGTYQGISHQLARVYVNLEMSRSLVLWAALSIDEGQPAATSAAAAAAATALPAAVNAAEVAIQVLGGIGVTWESPVHRYLKHALALSTVDHPASALRAQAMRKRAPSS